MLIMFRTYLLLLFYNPGLLLLLILCLEIICLVFLKKYFLCLEMLVYTLRDVSLQWLVNFKFWVKYYAIFLLYTFHSLIFFYHHPVLFLHHFFYMFLWSYQPYLYIIWYSILTVFDFFFHLIVLFQHIIH